MKTIVDANKKGLSLGLRELVQYRDLFMILAYRDYRVRYAQTYLGFFWAFFKPGMTLLIFALVFGKAANIDTGNVPYPVFAIVGMSAWQYFSFVMSSAGGSIIGAGDMIKKIYFPRLVIPLSKAYVGLVDFIIAFIFMVVIMVIYGFVPSVNLFLLPVFIFMNLICALAVGIWLSALTIRYRDFQHIIPFAVQAGLYITPIAYPASLLEDKIPEWAMALYFMNPVAGIVEGFRYAILGMPFQNQYFVFSFAVVILLFFSGWFYFRKVEKVMADIV